MFPGIASLNIYDCCFENCILNLVIKVSKKSQEDGNLSNVASKKAKKLQKIKTNVDNSLMPNTVTMASYQVISKYIS